MTPCRTQASLGGQFSTVVDKSRGDADGGFLVAPVVVTGIMDTPFPGFSERLEWKRKREPEVDRRNRDAAE
jgi:hypothetical protein